MGTLQGSIFDADGVTILVKAQDLPVTVRDWPGMRMVDAVREARERQAALMIDLASPGGEIAGRPGLFEAMLRTQRRRGLAKRYSRFPAWRYRASWRAW